MKSVLTPPEYLLETLPGMSRVRWEETGMNRKRTGIRIYNKKKRIYNKGLTIKSTLTVFYDVHYGTIYKKVI